MIPPKRVISKLDEPKPFIDQAGRDFLTLEVTSLAGPPRLNEKEVRVYSAVGVNVPSMLPISNNLSVGHPRDAQVRNHNVRR